MHKDSTTQAKQKKDECEEVLREIRQLENRQKILENKQRKEDMKMLYEETEKKEIERVYAVFADYIRESPYLEWFWSDKLGYLLLKIGAEKRYIAENVIIYTAEQLARILFSEVSMDVLQMTGNDHTEQTADPLELAEIKRRWQPFLERLPEYQTVCEKILAGEK